MSESGIQAVIFDLDGTLVNSEAVAARAVGDVFARYGVSLQPYLAELVTGKTWASAIEELEKHVVFPAPRELILDAIIDEYRVRLKSEVHPVPGSVEAISRLVPQYRLGLVSGSYRQEILFALGMLKVLQHFELILDATLEYLKLLLIHLLS
ncbi:HAD family phosphatase [bacterium]|nr:HAD family phosphatase [bacterium]